MFSACRFSADRVFFQRFMDQVLQIDMTGKKRDNQDVDKMLTEETD